MPTSYDRTWDTKTWEGYGFLPSTPSDTEAKDHYEYVFGIPEKTRNRDIIQTLQAIGLGLDTDALKTLSCTFQQCTLRIRAELTAAQAGSLGVILTFLDPQL